MSKATSRQESRKYERVLCGSATRFRSALGAAEGTCRDLSIGGMLLGGAALPLGELVELTLDLPGAGAVQLFGEVRHNRGDASASGIRFTHLTQRSLATLTRFIAAQA